MSLLKKEEEKETHTFVIFLHCNFLSHSILQKFLCFAHRGIMTWLIASALVDPHTHLKRSTSVFNNPTDLMDCKHTAIFIKMLSLCLFICKFICNAHFPLDSLTSARAFPILTSTDSSLLQLHLQPTHFIMAHLPMTAKTQNHCIRFCSVCVGSTASLSLCPLWEKPSRVLKFYGHIHYLEKWNIIPNKATHTQKMPGKCFTLFFLKLFQNSSIQDGLFDLLNCWVGKCLAQQFGLFCFESQT